jgi:ferredoxin
MGVPTEVRDVLRPDPPGHDDYGLVGFATFVDFWNPPLVMQEFIAALPVQHHQPAFAFCTYGSGPGSTLRSLARQLTARGFHVVAAHALHVPENYPPMVAKGSGFEDAPDEEELTAFRRFAIELGRVAGRLESGEPVPALKVKSPLLTGLIRFPRTWARRDMGPKFLDPALCTKCGACARHCLTGAVTLDPGPTFDEGKCTGCWACYNHCPTLAIHTRKFRGVGHYPRPNAQLREKLRP